MAECIAREVAAAINRPLSFAGAVDAVTNRLSTAHVDTAGAALRGLQRAVGRRPVDRQDARRRGAGGGGTRPAVAAGAAGPAADRRRQRHAVRPLPRPATNQGPAGWLRAKTGSLTAINSLVGVVTDRSGRVLTFAFISNDAGPNGRNAIDALASKLWTCGCRMTASADLTLGRRCRLAIRRHRRASGWPARARRPPTTPAAR